MQSLFATNNALGILPSNITRIIMGGITGQQHHVDQILIYENHRPLMLVMFQWLPLRLELVFRLSRRVLPEQQNV